MLHPPPQKDTPQDRVKVSGFCSLGFWNFLFLFGFRELRLQHFGREFLRDFGLDIRGQALGKGSGIGVLACILQACYGSAGLRNRCAKVRANFMDGRAILEDIRFYNGQFFRRIHVSLAYQKH